MPDEIDRLKIKVNGGAKLSTTSLSNRLRMLSKPVAFFVFKHFNCLHIELISIGLNSNGGGELS